MASAAATRALAMSVSALSSCARSWASSILATTWPPRRRSPSRAKCFSRVPRSWSRRPPARLDQAVARDDALGEAVGAIARDENETGGVAVWARLAPAKSGAVSRRTLCGDVSMVASARRRSGLCVPIQTARPGMPLLIRPVRPKGQEGAQGRQRPFTGSLAVQPQSHP